MVTSIISVCSSNTEGKIGSTCIETCFTLRRHKKIKWVTGYPVCILTRSRTHIHFQSFSILIYIYCVTVCCNCEMIPIRTFIHRYFKTFPAKIKLIKLTLDLDQVRMNFFKILCKTFLKEACFYFFFEYLGKGK